MASPSSEQALSRLRAYTPPASSIYDALPVSRRAAVLILLFAGAAGELRVVLTMRAETLSSFPGQAALPGGKASSPAESPQTTSLREAHEEIGLPRNHALTPLCLLPLYLAKTLLGVRPCIALLPTTSGSDTARSAIQSWRREPGEVAAVFDAPLRGFLDAAPGWYEGAWTQWYGEWRMHSFYVPRGAGGDGRKALAGDAAAAVPPHYKVWGMTARILVDAARIAYGEAPAFEHVAGFGDEGLIVRLMGEGELGPREERAGGGVGAGAGAEGGEGVKQEGDGDEGDDESSPAERAKM